jgi:hypothetical protein
MRKFRADYARLHYHMLERRHDRAKSFSCRHCRRKFWPPPACRRFRALGNTNLNLPGLTQYSVVSAGVRKQPTHQRSVARTGGKTHHGQHAPNPIVAKCPDEFLAQLAHGLGMHHDHALTRPVKSVWSRTGISVEAAFLHRLPDGILTLQLPLPPSLIHQRINRNLIIS